LGELRSVAVTDASEEPVLLYGAAARFAQDEQDAGRLRYAQLARPSGGDLVLVTGTIGTHIFVRPTPSEAAGTGDHRRCEDVDDVARPFVELMPPLAALWVMHMNTAGWTWPIRDASSDSNEVMFLGVQDGRILARGRCFEPTLCELRTRASTFRRSDTPTVDLADIRPHMP
jgi:hypothetical protein